MNISQIEKFKEYMDALQNIEKSFSEEEKLEAQDLFFSIENVTQIIIDQKQSIDRNFVTLSQHINRVREKKYWLLGKHKSFGDYIKDIEARFNVGKSQLYVYMTTTRNLLPSVGEEELVDIGITKAKVLSKYVEQSGQQTIPPDILASAKNPATTADKLDAEVNAKLHNVMPEKGKWFAIPGFFVDDDERAEILDAMELAKSIDPVVQNNIPHWQQMKEVVLRFSREFISSNS